MSMLNKGTGMDMDRNPDTDPVIVMVKVMDREIDTDMYTEIETNMDTDMDMDMDTGNCHGHGYRDMSPYNDFPVHDHLCKLT
jgi:hypothetical protein